MTRRPAPRGYSYPARRKHGLRFASKVVIGLFGLTVLFTVVMVITFWVKDSVPDGLITGWFATMGGELLSLALIRVFDEMNVGKKRQTEQGEDEEG